MAGTFADQATLADTASFIAKVRCAMIFRATELFNSASVQTSAVLNQSKSILQSAAGDAQNIARIVATGNPTIAAAAPAVPSDADVQYAVNTVLTSLLK